MTHHSKNNIAIARGKNNNEIYQYLGENKFENLTTGSSGRISKDEAKKYLVIPIPLNQMANENPILVDLIKSLNLKVEL